LAAGLRPDPLGSLSAPQTLQPKLKGWAPERGREKGGTGREGGEGRKE